MNSNRNDSTIDLVISYRFYTCNMEVHTGPAHLKCMSVDDAHQIVGSATTEYVVTAEPLSAVQL